MKAVVIASVSSGVGKTTITAGLIGALRARGLRVAPFKAGPDYIDPSYHSSAAGQPCRNLDSWMLPPDALKASFARAAMTADVAVIEGVMGLFDGHSAEGDAGSTAHLAKLLGLPVILVVDASGVARSAAATVLGYQQFDPAVVICGVILNRLGSERHLEIIRPVVEALGIPVLGGFLRDGQLTLPERHLGLVPAAERSPNDALARAAELAASRIDIDALLARAVEVPASTLTASRPVASRVPIAVARDAAFNFYYQDSLDLLTDAGADLIDFSPLSDTQLPLGVRGVVLGGGFPEMFADELAANSSMHASLRDADARGLPIYAECGGHMYLGRSLTDMDGATHPMAGLTEVASTVTGTKLTLGYRTVRSLVDSPILKVGETVRAHEFHLSQELVQFNEAALPSPSADGEGSHRHSAALGVRESEVRAYDLLSAPTPTTAGISRGNLLSSYIHIHFGAAPAAPARFVAACLTADRV